MTQSRVNLIEFKVLFGMVLNFMASFPVLLIASLVMIALDAFVALIRYSGRVTSRELIDGAKPKLMMAFAAIAGYLVSWVARHHAGLPDVNIPGWGPIAIDLGSVLAGFWIVSEMISILEHCKAAGVKLPPGIHEWLGDVEKKKTNA